MNADNVVLLAEHEATTDPLRQGLALLCRQLGRPLGIAELGEGMPLQQGRLPLRFVPRALRRADIVARVERLPLVKMDSYLLPALLVLEDGGTLVLCELDGESARVLVPHSDGGVERL